MARNDIYLNINALSPADAVVTGQQDMTAATIPELVLGDTPSFNFYFTDNTNVWPSWAGNAAYTLTWALSDAVAGDFAPAATTSAATAITGGWSVVLPLNAYDLVGLLNTKRVGQPFPVQNLWQQLRVTDPSGNEITRAMFWTPIRYRAISDTQNSESASPTGARFVAVNNVNELTTPTAAQFYAANPVPTSALGTAANGELLIGNGTGFTKSTLTAGDGITITNAAGSITIDASAAQEKLTATVKNAESTPITKGQVVYLFGATGNVASVKLAYNTSDATSAKTFGVVSSSSISAGGTGLVTCVGVVDGLNLGAYQDGDTLYLGATPGSVTATKPYAPNHLVYVGVVERANSGNGELYVKVQNGYELDEIHDVQINAPRQSGQTLIYDNTTSLWKNARITAGTNIGVTNGDGSISIAFSGTLPVANGGTGVTTSTGSGSVVLSTSPTLTTPILGTPQSGTLSSCTGLPISSGVSGLGTNVASALGTNVGSAGAFVVNGGALGTPSSGTLSSCSGLPISTGVSGLGTNVATFLATPSSANLAAAVTDETGTGALVFANTPTLVTPNIGAATGTSFNLTGSGTLGTTLAVNGTTDSSSKDTGAIVTEGGLGVEKSANIGGNATVGGTLTVSGGTVGTAASTDLTLAGGSSGASLVLGQGTNANVSLTPSGSGSARITNAFSNSGLAQVANSPQLALINSSNYGYPVGLMLRSKLTNGGAEINNGGIWAEWSSDNNAYLGFATTASGTLAERARITSGGNLLLGTTTDSSNGKVQLATHTTSAGGIGFGTDLSLFRVTTNKLELRCTADAEFSFAFQRTAGSYQTKWDNYIAANGTSLVWYNGGDRLTLDTSGNATFAGKVTVNGTSGIFAAPTVNTNGLTLTGYDTSGDYVSVGGQYASGNTGHLAQVRFYSRATGGTASSMAFAITSSGSVVETLKLNTDQSATFSGSLTTAAPTSGTAKAWKLGEVATVSPTSPNRTIRVEIDGTVYYIAAKTTND